MWLRSESCLAGQGEEDRAAHSFDKSNRTDGIFSRSDFTGEVDDDHYICPNIPMRKVPRDVHEDARDVARAIATTPEYEESRHRRKKVEMLFAQV
jgi:hypothetical protein